MVRIRFPPAESRANHRFLSCGAVAQCVPAMRRLCRRTPLFDRFLKLDGLVEQAESPSIVS
jgi:hypothetical protein